MRQNYQPWLVNGKVASRGARPCDDRYEYIRQLCAKYKRPFTCLDIGANRGFFGISLERDFPDVTVVNIEAPFDGTSGYGDQLVEALKKNDCKRNIALLKRMSSADLSELADVEHFDVTIAFSVIHYFDTDYMQSVDILKRMGDHLLLELPTEDKAAGQRVVQQIKQEGYPPDATLLGHVQSHVGRNELRPILHIATPKHTLTRSYVGAKRLRSKMGIISDFERKEVEFVRKKERRREWRPGINLKTFLEMGGAYPSKQSIADHLKSKGVPEQRHGDLKPWNCILGGTCDIDYIDYGDITCFDDNELLHKMISYLEG